jgi:ATP-dependent DNA ligase
LPSDSRIYYKNSLKSKPSQSSPNRDHIDYKGKELYKLAQQHKIEGIVAKYKQGLYYPGGRSTGWIKIKTAQVVQGVIAGFILDEDKPGTGFNSLIIAQKKEKGYKYIGQVGTGVTRAALNKVFQAKRSRSIFSPVPNVNIKTAFRNPIKRPKVVSDKIS